MSASERADDVDAGSTRHASLSGLLRAQVEETRTQLTEARERGAFTAAKDLRRDVNRLELALFEEEERERLAPKEDATPAGINDALVDAIDSGDWPDQLVEELLEACADRLGLDLAPILPTEPS